MKTLRILFPTLLFLAMVTGMQSFSISTAQAKSMSQRPSTCTPVGAGASTSTRTLAQGTIQPLDGESGTWRTYIDGLYNSCGTLTGIYGLCVSQTNEQAELIVGCVMTNSHGLNWNPGDKNKSNTTILVVTSPTFAPGGSGTTWLVCMSGADFFIDGFVAYTPNYPSCTYDTVYTE